MTVVWLRASLLGLRGSGGDDAASAAKQIAARAGPRHEQNCQRVMARNLACEPYCQVGTLMQITTCDYEIDAVKGIY